MLTLRNDFDQTLALMDTFRNQVSRFFDDYDARSPGGSAAAGPLLNLFDTGDDLVLMADIPGLTEKDITLHVQQDVFTIRGQRRVSAPEGFKAHRRERVSYEFSRSFGLPTKVDLERAQANVKDGVLTVTLPKAPETKPRQIAVRGH